MHTFIDSDVVYSTVVRAVTPYLGEVIAESAVVANRQKLGLDGAVLTSQQAEDLLGRVAMTLNVFLGRAKSAQLLSEIRAGLDAKGGSR